MLADKKTDREYCKTCNASVGQAAIFESADRLVDICEGVDLSPGAVAVLLRTMAPFCQKCLGDLIIEHERDLVQISR